MIKVDWFHAATFRGLAKVVKDRELPNNQDMGKFREFLLETRLAANLFFAVSASRMGLRRAPFKYIVAVTKKCNSKCRNCLIWTEKIADELTLAEYERIAKASPDLLWLNLTGGEVTLRDDVVEIVRTFKQHCPKLDILNFTTNGIDTEKIVATIRKLQEIPFVKFSVNVSLDGPTEIHDKQRGIKGNFASALRTYREIKNLGHIESFLSFTVYDSNYASFDQMVEEVRKQIPSISMHDFHLNLENTSAHFYGNTKLKTIGESARRLHLPGKIELFKNFLQRTKGKGLLPIHYFKRLYHRYALQFLKTGTSPIPCMAMKNSVYISEHGDIFPCVVWNKKVASLRSENFDVARIARSSTAVDLKNKIQNRQCQNCWTPCEAYHSLISRPLGI